MPRGETVPAAPALTDTATDQRSNDHHLWIDTRPGDVKGHTLPGMTAIRAMGADASNGTRLSSRVAMRRGRPCSPDDLLFARRSAAPTTVSVAVSLVTVKSRSCGHIRGDDPFQIGDQPVLAARQEGSVSDAFARHADSRSTRGAP